LNHLFAFLRTSEFSKKIEKSTVTDFNEGITPQCVAKIRRLHYFKRVRFQLFDPIRHLHGGKRRTSAPFRIISNDKLGQFVGQPVLRYTPQR
jgi:hypothetical protein